MSRAEMIVFLRAERCSYHEIAAAMAIRTGSVKRVLQFGGRWSKPLSPATAAAPAIDEPPPRQLLQRHHRDLPAGWGFL